MSIGDRLKSITQNNNKNKKNFTYLDNLIHSDRKEIFLDDDIILETSFQYKEQKIFPDGVMLDVDNLVIDGNGHTIDAKGKIPIFCCSGENIILKNITFKNGFSRMAPAGTLLSQENSSINIVNCNFVNNESNAGGAIAALNGSIINIESTIFDNNSSSDSGGAILSFGEVSLVDCKFLNNSAKKVGGAINNQKSGVLTVKNTEFINNHSNMDAGAIANLGKCTLDICEFSKNSTKEYGDAIYNQPLALLDINNSNFVNHDVNYALLFNQGELNLNEGTIKRNYSKNADCLIFSHPGSSLTCSNYNFIGNYYQKGACINNSSDNSKFIKCSFSNNKNNSVIFNRKSLDLIDCIFENNECNFYVIDSFDKQSILNLFGGEIKNNSAKTTLFNSGKSCTINQTVFNNIISRSGSYEIINESHLYLEHLYILDEFKVSQKLLNQSFEYKERSDSSSKYTQIILNKGQLDVSIMDVVERTFLISVIENYGHINFCEVSS